MAENSEETKPVQSQEETQATQPQTENENKNENQNVVIPEVVNSAPKPQPSVAPAKSQRGCMIASIICGILSVLFVILAVFMISPFIDLFINSSSEAELFLGVLMFFLYMVTLGLVSWLPALILSIVTLCCSVKCWSSPKGGTKAVGIVFFIISLLVLLACVGVLLLFVVPGTLSLISL